MQKNNKFSYTENGITIVFNELPKKEYQKGAFFEFEVQDNPELTDKLRNSVVNKRVREKHFLDCTKNLFAIIVSGNFKKVVTRKQSKYIYKKSFSR